MNNAEAVISIKNLNFGYNKDKLDIKNLNCLVYENSKVILVGPNGAGKSTLLRILGGGIFMNLEYDEFSVNGSCKVNDQHNGVTYLGGTWKRRRTGFEGICPYTMDIAARNMMEKWQEEFKDRRDELVKVLGINLDWRMHECSDGQRKKVRIMIKLLRPFKLCIIDEFIADLDLFSRARLLNYFDDQCQKYKACVIYATHIFDQLDEWASHITFMKLDKTLSPIYSLENYSPYQEIIARTGTERSMCPMYSLVYEELAKQYKEHSKLLTGQQHCITDLDISDLIIEQQISEVASDAHLVEQEKKMSSWVDGRLARELTIKDIDKEKKKSSLEQQKKRNQAILKIKQVVENNSLSDKEKINKIQEMKKNKELDEIAGPYQTNDVVKEILSKISSGRN